MDNLHLVVQGTVRMEKVLHLKQKDGHSNAEKSTSAAMKEANWPTTSEKINCGIGEVETYEHFGLPEMLFCCIAKTQQGEKGSSLPSPCRFSAKNSTMITRVLKISSGDFLKAMPVASINSNRSIDGGISRLDRLQIDQRGSLRSTSFCNCSSASYCCCCCCYFLLYSQVSRQNVYSTITLD